MSRVIKVKIVDKLNNEEVILDRRIEVDVNEGGNLARELRSLQAETNEVLTEIVEREKENGGNSADKNEDRYFEDCSGDDEDEDGIAQKKTKIE